ncbi:MAG: hypothetical protein J6Q68_01825 [Clostridia bacterium]|nr:hypothetical protein [Clostridia bacterium]
MKNKKKIDVLGIVLTFVVLSLIAGPMLFNLFVYELPNFGDVDYYIFENIEECEKIETLNFTEQKITKYENPEKDKNLKSLQYEAFYGAKYESQELTFEIFAYEFATEEDAAAYFKNSSARKATDKSTFAGSRHAFSADFQVIYYNRVYSVRTTNKHMQAAKDALGTIFSIKI